MSDESANGYDARADEWVVVRNCGYMHEAELIVAMLDAEGIDAFIPDAQMGGGVGLTVLIQGVRVLVRASDLEEANETLLVWDDEAISDGEEDFADDDIGESGESVDDFPE
ncbi:putative signal transducing protein [Longimicrobium sp.]|jgi:cadmium resistance protein CadD (predicted permease)|uniref:putative signal transducing protein n=1 Tax=Longimicrobium sp. TaxID=2029185 RepID=UPI002EDA1B04